MIDNAGPLCYADPTVCYHMLPRSRASPLIGKLTLIPTRVPVSMIADRINRGSNLTTSTLRPFDAAEGLRVCFAVGSSLNTGWYKTPRRNEPLIFATKLEAAIREAIAHLLRDGGIVHDGQGFLVLRQP